MKLELIVQAQDDGATLLRLAAAKQLPDICQTGSGIFSALRQSNQMMVLNDVAEKTGFAAKEYETCKEFLYSDDSNIYAFRCYPTEKAPAVVDSFIEKESLHIHQLFEEEDPEEMKNAIVLLDRLIKQMEKE